MAGRVAIFLYGVLSYLVFLATFLYAIGFIGNFGVPKAMDSSPAGDFIPSLLIDLGLLGLFALQHSIMARSGFKRWLTRSIPEPAERSTYVLASSLALIALFVYWQPLGGIVWSVEDPAARGVIYACYVFGWLLVLAATFLINHFDLFGLRQVWLHLLGRPYVNVGFRTPGPYRYVRHPLYVGWLFVFWSTPVMTYTHLLFAVMTTGYILVGIQLEERDLVRALGAQYRDYREHVPMLIPFTRARYQASNGTARERSA